MKPPLLPLLVMAALLCSACSKSAAPDASSATASPAPTPRGNLTESLGFASSDDVYSPPPPSASGPAASSPTTPITRTLTGKDGRTLDAVLLSRSETAVKIRRNADAVEFTIPLDKLSAADRAFIQQSGLPVTPDR